MSARRGHRGRSLGLGPPEGQNWTWMTNAMLGSITFRALGIHARRILDFLVYEHASHAGRENGNLAATYRQLERWGVTAADVRKGFAELTATGFVEVKHQGLRQAGGGEPSRYALTWLPNLAGTSRHEVPSHAWLDVLDKLRLERIGSVGEARRWLKAEVAGLQRRPKTTRSATPHLQAASPLICEARFEL
jgi:hypothetical protein